MSDLIKQKKREAVVLQNSLRKNRDNYMKFIKEVKAEEEKGNKKDEKLIKEKVEEVKKLLLAENKMLEELKPLMAEIKELEEAKGDDIFNKLISNADARAENLSGLGGRKRRRKKRTRKRRKSRRRKRRKSKGRKRRRKKSTKRRRRR